MSDSNNIARNTKKKPRGKPFVKGDPRCHRAGRPKSFDALRKLAVQIGREIDPATDLPTVEKIMRDWSKGNFNEQKSFIEIAYGKVPDKLEVDGQIVVNPPKRMDHED